MSMYGNSEKDYLYGEMCDFLDEHPSYELVEMVADAIRETEGKE